MNFNPKFTQSSFRFLNLRNVRLLLSSAIGVLLILAGSDPARGQSPAPASAQQADQFFAGIVTALADDSITITRTALGKSTVRVFAITPETVVQGGKPKLKSKVTVKWMAGENGDCALKIIMRGSVPAPKKP